MSGASTHIRIHMWGERGGEAVFFILYHLYGTPEVLTQLGVNI